MWNYLGTLPIVYFFIQIPFIKNKLKFTYLLYLNGIVNIILKLIIRQPRPIMYYPFDYGMPSGHAQCIWFMIMYGIRNGVMKHLYIKLLAIVFGIIVCIQRVKVKRHTISQVIMGTILGNTFGYYAPCIQA